MTKKQKVWCEKCQKKTTHETRVLDDQETYICLRCEILLKKENRMLDLSYVDPRERYSLRPDRAFEEDRIRIGRPF